MYKEILSKEQFELLDFLKEFKKKFYLVGGTAIALHIGHRRSIDFDLFTPKLLDLKTISDKFYSNKISISRIFIRTKEQFTLNCNSVQITFFNYPYNIEHNISFENYLNLPTLLDLAAMKAFALGKRSKWKDYVDIYFILKYHHRLDEIIEKAKELYSDHFSAKLFRGQLTFFDDINYDEEVIYLDAPVDTDVIKKFLIDAATEKF